MERPTNSKRKLKPRKLPSECLCCGEENPWVINKVEFVAPFRETEHSFRAEAHQCRHCDAISTSPEQVEAISAKVRDAHKAWISQKFKEACRELGVSIRDLVGLTDIPFATLARASSGESLIEATVEKMLWQEIEVLRQRHLATAWIHMSIPAPSATVTIRMQPAQHHYSLVLKNASQSPLMTDAKPLWEASGQALQYA
jgi:hypothetical protein